MSEMASQITSLTMVYSTVYSTDQRKHKKRSTGLCEWNSPVTSEFPHRGPVTRKMFPFDDVIMSRTNFQNISLQWHNNKANIEALFRQLDDSPERVNNAGSVGV